MSQNSELIARLRDLSKMLDEYEGGNFKWSEEAATAREAADALQALDYDDSDTIPDNDKVICPSCCHQFQAIPASVQVRLQALERVPMTEWQPIDTAPKDGRTLLLGYFNSHKKWRTMRGQWFSQDVINEEWEEPDMAGEGWYETCVENDDMPNCWWTAPTHWHPLPTPPESKG